MKIAIISCNLCIPRKYENQKQVSDNEIDYFYFNDKNFVLRKNAMHPRLQAKIPKMLGWQLCNNYDFYIWLDANITFSNEKSVDWLIEKCKTNIAFFSHFERKSIREELDFIIDKMKKGDQYLISRCEYELMEEQIDFYFSHKDFKDSYLFACGIFIYKKELIVEKFNVMEQWFYHCARWSVRDQLSIPFLLWLNNIKFDVINEHLLKNSFLKYNI